MPISPPSYHLSNLQRDTALSSLSLSPTSSTFGFYWIIPIIYKYPTLSSISKEMSLHLSQPMVLKVISQEITLLEEILKFL